MLKDDFFKIITLETGAASVKALLELDPGHEIFKGHFPATPVVPGVCIMQMVKELLELNLERSLQLSKAASMKFLAVIDPRSDTMVKVDLYIKNVEAGIEVNASLSSGERVCFKFNGLFVEAN